MITDRKGTRVLVGDPSNDDPVWLRVVDEEQVAPVKIIACTEVSSAEQTVDIMVILNEEEGGKTCRFLHLGGGYVRHQGCFYGAKLVQRLDLTCRHPPEVQVEMERVAGEHDFSKTTLVEDLTPGPSYGTAVSPQTTEPYRSPLWWSNRSGQTSPTTYTQGGNRKNRKRRKSERMKKSGSLFPNQASSRTDATAPSKSTEEAPDRTAFNLCESCGNRHPARDPCSEWS